MRERKEDKKREKEKQRGRGEFCASPANAFRKLFKSTLMKSKTNSIVPPTPDSAPPPPLHILRHADCIFVYVLEPLHN